MKKFNVIIWDVNAREFVPYNIIPYLLNQYKTAKVKPTTTEEFAQFIKKESMYQWWGRCEYEIILKDWPCGQKEEKIDVYWQVMMNINIITEILIEQVHNT